MKALVLSLFSSPVYCKAYFLHLLFDALEFVTFGENITVFLDLVYFEEELIDLNGGGIYDFFCLDNFYLSCIYIIPISSGVSETLSRRCLIRLVSVSYPLVTTLYLFSIFSLYGYYGKDWMETNPIEEHCPPYNYKSKETHPYLSFLRYKTLQLRREDI